jgi:RHS repeat-associated protein
MPQQLTRRAVVASIAALACTAALAQTRPVTQFFYDANGNLTMAVDGLNRSTSQSYDALNRLRTITQPPPGALQPNPVIRIDVNARDDITKVTDPRNLATNYTVNGFGDAITQVSPDTGTTTRTFDAAGNLKTSRDARGKTTTYLYDSINRLTRALYADGTNSYFYYDESVNGIGRLTRMVDPGSLTTVWTYDIQGRVVTKTQTIGTITHQLSYSYNPTTGQLASMTYPSGRIVTYNYGSTTKDLATVRLDGVPVASSISWHPLGDVKRMTLGNSRVWSTALDQDGRIKSYTLAGVTYTVVWDAANRIVAINHATTPSLNQSFGYDNLDRITSFASTPRSQSFAYDLTGNLLAKSDVVSGVQTDTTYSIAPTSNRMTGISSLGIGYSFDLAGNRTGDGRISYLYNARGRLYRVNIINGAVTQTFNYLVNGINQRVRKTGPSTIVPQGTQIFVYDEAGKLVGEYDNLGRARTEHIWVGDRPAAALTYTYSGTSTTPLTKTVSYVETDHLGTPRLVTNASRQARWSWVSAPYGDTFPNENPSALGAYPYNLRFAGQFFDKETNHHYNWHRDYESTTGRYVQSDPIGLDGGLNTYQFLKANPLGLVDPDGLFGLPWEPRPGWNPPMPQAPSTPRGGIFICNRAVEGFPGAGNHSYLWDPGRRRACSMRGSFGTGQDSEVELGPSRHSCVKVPDSEGKEDQVMNCCKRTANNGMWVPGINDCHNAAEFCLRTSGLPSLAAPGGRLGQCDSCNRYPLLERSGFGNLPAIGF